MRGVYFGNSNGWVRVNYYIAPQLRNLQLSRNGKSDFAYQFPLSLIREPLPACTIEPPYCTHAVLAQQPKRHTNSCSDGVVTWCVARMAGQTLLLPDS